MSGVHEWIGYGVVALFAIGWLWPTGAAIARRDPGARYWQWLAAAQVVSVLQVLVGLILVFGGFRPTTWLHYVYGAGPLLILLVAHPLARELQRGGRDRRPIRPSIVFGFAAFICFGLTLRGLLTGLGIG
jgi:zinc transporter ZupT